MDNRKNTILLTVIAIATLLVAVVGATFAYFTAQGGNTKTSDVTVTTSTSDSSSFQSGALVLTANQQNFGQANGNVESNGGEATVNFTANSEADSKLCYDITFTVDANPEVGGVTKGTFEYRPKYVAVGTSETLNNSLQYYTKTGEGDSAVYTKEFNPTQEEIALGKYYITSGHVDNPKPELVLTILRTTYDTGSAVSNYYTTANLPSGVSYVSNVQGKEDAAAFGAYDITTLSASQSITLPGLELPATKGTTAHEDWLFKVILVNYDWDQDYNTDKQMVGTIKFEKQTCTAGS